MNRQLQIIIGVILSIAIAISAVTYGALTARQQHSEGPKTTPKIDLQSTLDSEMDTIRGVLLARYPVINNDYTITKSKLYDEGQWFGCLLVYKGSDTLNRDTLRAVLQKKNGVWILKTTPPEPILSAKKYPDVPKSILKDINTPIGLP